MLKELLDFAQVSARLQIELCGSRRSDVHQRKLQQGVILDKLRKIDDEIVTGCRTRRNDPIP